MNEKHLNYLTCNPFFSENKSMFQERNVKAEIIHKTLLTTMFIVTLACQAQPVSKEIKNDLAREGLKGNVKIMTVTEYDFDTDDDGNVEKEWERQIRKSYNRQGYMVEECRYDEDGSLSRKTTVERDSLGIAIKRQLHFNGDGELLGTGIYIYDDNGNLAEITKYDHSGNMTDRLSYVYDNKGNLIEEKHQMLLPLNGKSSVTDEFVSKGEYKDGLLHKKEAYQDGKKIAEHQMTYNAAGKIEGQTTFDGDGNFRWRHVFHYNEQGDAYKWIGYSESGKVRAEGEGRFEYDSQGNAIKKTVLSERRTYFRRNTRDGVLLGASLHISKHYIIFVRSIL